MMCFPFFNYCLEIHFAVRFCVSFPNEVKMEDNGDGNSFLVNAVSGAEAGGCCGGLNECSLGECGSRSTTNEDAASNSSAEAVSMLIEACAPPLNATNTVFSMVVDEVKERMTGADVNTSTVTILLKYAMEAVELTQVRGAEQKELAVKIVRKIVVDAPLSKEVEAACMAIVDSGVLSDVVDLVIDATKGRLDVNRLKKKGKKCLLGCIKG